MSDFQRNGLQLDSFGHIGLIVRNCEAAAESLSSRLGIGPWTFRDVGANKMAFASLGPVQFELIEPVAEKTIWAEFLNSHGEGLHHICGFVPDVDAAVAKLVEKGGEVLVSTPGIFAYVSLGEPGSIILELLKSQSER